MRIVLCGQRTFGAEALKLLIARGDDVALVVSPPYRDEKLPGWADDVALDRLHRAAREQGLPWQEAATFTADCVPPRVDLIVAAHAHNFVSRKARDRALLGAVGFHPSLLPRHRGRDAIRWTIHMHDVLAGGSIYWLTDNVDAGPLAAQNWCWVRADDTASSLWERELFPMGVRLLGQTLADLDRGTVRQVPQDEQFASWEPSWERPPLHRPDLLALGAMPDGYEVTTERR